MANDVAAASSIAPTLPEIPYPVRAAIAFKPDDGSRPWVLKRAMTSVERVALKQDLRRLDNGFAPFRSDRLHKIASPLLGVWPFRDSESTDAFDVGCAVAWEGLPEWALRSVILAYCQSRIERVNHAFRPTPAEVAEQANVLLSPYRNRQYEIGRILNAVVEAPRESDEEYERRRALVEKLRGPAGDWGLKRI